MIGASGWHRSMNAPFVETLQQATHFKRGPEVYAGGINPWQEPFFPTPSAITNQDGQ